MSGGKKSIEKNKTGWETASDHFRWDAFSGKAIFVQRLEWSKGISSEGIWGKSLPGRKNNAYKAPEAGV